MLPTVDKEYSQIREPCKRIIYIDIKGSIMKKCMLYDCTLHEFCSKLKIYEKILFDDDKLKELNLNMIQPKTR